ncbi:hypothetical protein KCH_14640 [Kitasatospora cheerisanensis KCTC 2395]|uniref:Uncharacterized protein n=1 Tax=Kitasatospora cheerisanensis KCTC 2395 TaxID=1348663 RepID=A0A066Z3L6_9ACTN|nr:hypothetical protein KCH_14640 [Kitasatospora cheerisanensis KCTC 2395]
MAQPSTTASAASESPTVVITSAASSWARTASSATMRDLMREQSSGCFGS